MSKGSFRTVELKSLKPNPMRDFTIDPLDKEAVAKLKESIDEYGFWSGVSARSDGNGGIEVAGGWHRVKAAIEAGERRADIFIGDYSDAEMIRAYASENATQRGNSTTAVAGMVASAVRFLAKCLLTGQFSPIGENLKGLEEARGNLASAKGLGEPFVTAFLNRPKPIPGVNRKTVQQQFANLKASGDYARLIQEVRKEIEHENAKAIEDMKKAERARDAAIAAAEKAERERKEAAARAKAAKEERDRERAVAASKKAEIDAKIAETHRKALEKEAAKWAELRDTVDDAQAASDKAKRDKTFDFEGVAKHLHNPYQVQVFREVVTSENVLPYLAVNKQAALAAKLLKTAKEQEAEFTGGFIRQNAMSLVMDVQQKERDFSRADRDRIKVHGWEATAKEYQGEFSRGVRMALAAALDIIKHNKSRPANSTFYQTGEFASAVVKLRELCGLTKQLEK